MVGPARFTARTQQLQWLHEKASLSPRPLGTGKAASHMRFRNSVKLGEATRVEIRFSGTVNTSRNVPMAAVMTAEARNVVGHEPRDRRP
jgi:hypothetical protein